MVSIIATNPLLLLFLVAALGYPLGRIKIGSFSLGVAAVLFVGLAIGAIDPRIKLPEIVYQFGLVLFVYTIGLSSGRSFFASFKKKGLRDNAMVVVLLLGVFGMTLIAARMLRLGAPIAVGMFTGSVTNTPALASVLEFIKATMPAKGIETILTQPVVGYSIAYPMGVVGMLLAITFCQRLWHVDYAAEAKNLRELGNPNQRLHCRTITVTQPHAEDASIHDLVNASGWDVTFGRIKHRGAVGLVSQETHLAVGDVVSVVGERPELQKVITSLGEESQTRLEMDRTEIDFRRIIVSNPKVAGHHLSDINLPEQYGAIVTRIRRGDNEFLPQDDTIIELGDRLRIVARRENLQAVGAFLGDSYRSLGEVNIMTFSVGLVLGLALGLVPIPLPGVTIKLGIAGGPLVVALILGALERTGPVLWNLPYNANMTLRQLGLILFLAGVGTRAGYAFVSTFTKDGGLAIFAAGALITMIFAFLTLFIGYKLLKIPMSILTGILAGMQTQPAVLGFALEQSHNDLPNVGYAEVYPVATITKIILAQLLLTILLR